MAIKLTVQSAIAAVIDNMENHDPPLRMIMVIRASFSELGTPRESVRVQAACAEGWFEYNVWAEGEELNYEITARRPAGNYGEIRN